MSEVRRDREYLNDIAESMRRIVTYIEGISYEHFMSDTKTQDAVIRNLEVIGEAAKKLSAPLKRAYPEIPWKNMAGMRDKVIHHYFGINYDIVWTVASQDVPKLLPRILDILNRE